MTRNRRAQRDARERQRATGEKYIVAKRRSAKDAPPPEPVPVRVFVPDSCASYLEPLPNQANALFCSDLCRDIAEVVRYWRRISRDGRDKDPEVQQAMRTQVAHLLAGGYHEKERRLSPAVRKHIMERDHGRCVQCGGVGKEIDHIDGDSGDPSNLQLLCKGCHHAKTAKRMRPANAAQVAWVNNLRETRVAAEVPTLLCDDPDEWKVVCRPLRRERMVRLHERLAELGYKRRDFPHTTWKEMWDFLTDGVPLPEWDDDDDGVEWVDEDSGWGEHDDGGYGPGSYFAHAMSKTTRATSHTGSLPQLSNAPGSRLPLTQARRWPALLSGRSPTCLQAHRIRYPMLCPLQGP